ncbi:MAG: hypothetical protein OXC26_17660 [Albidovulum sp.]|nr:hypothetical protein [Albidovulum sp.]
MIAAKQRGTYRNRSPKVDMDAIRHPLAEGQSPAKILRGTVFYSKDAAEQHRKPDP